MELVFLFTGWDFEEVGKATDFSDLCSALGVAFDLRDSKHGVLGLQNIEKRVQDLARQSDLVHSQEYPRRAALRLRGRLGSFMVDLEPLS